MRKSGRAVVEIWRRDHSRFGFGRAQQGFQINFVMHGAGMLERILLRQPLTVSEIDLAAMEENPLYGQLHVHVQSFSRLMNIEVPKTEEYYLLELIKTITKKKCIFKSCK